MDKTLINTKRSSIILALLAVATAAIMFFASACSFKAVEVKAQDLMKGVKSSETQGKTLDSAFTSSISKLSIDLFKQGVKQDENSLISPTSILLALSMTANGAEGETLKEMEQLLGQGLSIEDLNKYLYTYVKELPNSKKTQINIANSIWLKDVESFKAKEEFLQTNANYYNASIYKADFSSQDTVKDINHWVSNNTNKMIDKIVEEISADTIMYLINAMAFEGEWQRIYEKNQINEGIFTNHKGVEETAEFMRSDERLYLEDSMATGFLKPYEGDGYSFFALLPKEGIDINTYINSLEGESFLKLINSASEELVTAAIPKFSYNYSINLNSALQALGIKAAFMPSEADFSRLGSASDGNIFIGEVEHKTFISVDEKGTKAGAVTSVAMTTESFIESKYVSLDRPFVYGIIDNQTKLPIFIGTLLSTK